MSSNGLAITQGLRANAELASERGRRAQADFAGAFAETRRKVECREALDPTVVAGAISALAVAVSRVVAPRELPSAAPLELAPPLQTGVEIEALSLLEDRGVGDLCAELQGPKEAAEEARNPGSQIVGEDPAPSRTASGQAAADQTSRTTMAPSAASNADVLPMAGAPLACQIVTPADLLVLAGAGRVLHAAVEESDSGIEAGRDGAPLAALPMGLALTDPAQPRAMVREGQSSTGSTPVSPAARIEEFGLLWGRIEPTRAEVTVGEGAGRVQVAVRARREGLHVEVTVASEALAIALQQRQHELGAALAAHGLNLSKLETRSQGDPPRRPPDETPGEQEPDLHDGPRRPRPRRLGFETLV